MKRVTKIIIGAVASLGILAGVGAYAGKHHGHHMKGEFMIYKLDKELELSDAQVNQLKGIQSYMMEKRKQHNHDDMKAKVMGMLKSPSLDQSQAMAMIEEKMQTMRDNAPEMIGKVAEFTDGLDESQRAKMITMMEKFSKHRGRH